MYVAQVGLELTHREHLPPFPVCHHGPPHCKFVLSQIVCGNASLGPTFFTGKRDRVNLFQRPARLKYPTLANKIMVDFLIHPLLWSFIRKEEHGQVSNTSDWA